MERGLLLFRCYAEGLERLAEFCFDSTASSWGARTRSDARWIPRRPRTWDLATKILAADPGVGVFDCVRTSHYAGFDAGPSC
jgi:hypothetical protein